MTKERIIEVCSNELNRYFLLSSVEFKNGYYNYANYESVEMVGNLPSKGEYKIVFGFNPDVHFSITTGNVIHGKQLVRQTGFDLITISDKGDVQLEAEIGFDD